MFQIALIAGIVLAGSEVATRQSPAFKRFQAAKTDSDFFRRRAEEMFPDIWSEPPPKPGEKKK
jgi:hypothetical protein